MSVVVTITIVQYVTLSHSDLTLHISCLVPLCCYYLDSFVDNQLFGHVWTVDHNQSQQLSLRKDKLAPSLPVTTQLLWPRLTHLRIIIINSLDMKILVSSQTKSFVTSTSVYFNRVLL